jgi:hypothetical protein
MAEHMTFLDEIMVRLDAMSADDVIEAVGGGMYINPAIRGELHNYPQFIQDIIYIVDLDTALNMDGDVLVNNEGELPGMLTALRNIHADKEASLLQRIYDIYKANPHYDAICGTVDGLYKEMYLYTGFDIWGLLELYVELEKRKL